MKNLSIKTKKNRVVSFLIIILLLSNIGYINAEAFVLECPDDVMVSTTPGTCSGIASWTIFPPTGNPDATVMCTHESGDTFPIGTTTVSCVSVDASGNDVTCQFNVTVDECMANEIITENLTLIVDSDLPVGKEDTESFNDNGTYLFTDPATPANAVLSNISLGLYFRVEFASCESDIEVRLTDPAGNVVYEGVPFTTCDGSGGAPFPGQLYTITIPIPNANTTGNIANWVAEFRDTDDQNPGAPEYTVRFGKLFYETSITSGTGGENCGNPVIVNCPAGITQAANTNCGAVISIPEPMYGIDFTDCFNATAANSHNGTPDASGFYPIGTTIVTWTFTDEQGNKAICEQSITITGDSSPTLTCPADVIVATNIGECTPIATWNEPNPTYCDDNGMLSSTHNSGDTFPLGTTTVTYTATNSNGNESTCSFEVTIEECDSPPNEACADPIIINCPTDITTTSNGTGSAFINIPEPQFDVDFTDCMSATMTNDYNGTSNASDTYPSGTTIVLWTATDVAGNTSTCLQTITVNSDIEAPEFLCPSAIQIETTPDVCSAIATWDSPAFANNYPDGSITNSTHDSGDIFPIGTTLVTYTADDGQGNTVTCSFEVRVIDLQGPAVTCPTDITVETAPGMCSAIATWDAPQFTDNCNASIAGVSHNSGDVFPIGTTTVTYNIADETGNTAVCSFEVTVAECASPPPITTSLSTPDDNDFFIGENDTENFADNSTLIFTDPGTSADAVLTNITLQFYFRIFGNSCESDIEIRLTDPTGNATTFSDIYTTCEGEGPLYFIELNVPSGATTGTIANWVAEFRDTNDQNTGTSEYSVRWGSLSYDTVVSGSSCADPIIVNCPENITTMSAGTSSAFVNISEPQFDVDFTDCMSAIMTNDYNGTSNASDTYPSGTTVVVWTATDAAGNISTCLQTITVEGDIEAPEFVCPSDIQLETMPGMCSAVATWNLPAFANNYSDGSIINSTRNSGDIFPIGITPVTYTAADGQGNTVTCSFEVEVQECPSPPPIETSLVAPDDEDFYIGENDSQNFADNPTLNFTDLGTPVNAVLTNIKLELYFRVFGNSCENDIEVRLTDPTGNANVFTPFATCNGEGPLYFIELNVPNGTTIGTAADWIAEFRDKNDQNPSEAEYSVRWGRLSYNAIADGGGCANPTIVNCPQNISVPPGADGCSTFVEIPEPQFGIDFMDCTSATITNSYNGSSNATDTYSIGITTVIWTATDTEGNTAACVQIIRVEDTEAPSVTCPQNIMMETMPGMCGAIATWDTPLFSDNCGASITNVSHDSGDIFPIGTTIVSYNIADDAGNTAVCSFEVTVEECASPPPVATSIAAPDDEDFFVGENDTQNFADNPTLNFTDPGTPANAVLTNIKLELYFRIFGNSCESDIEVRLTDPAGNSNIFTPYATCMGEGPLYFIEINVPGGATTGTTADWITAFRDTNDQNPGESEYSVRWGRLSYETITSGGGCADPIIVNCPENITTNSGDCGAFVEIPEPQFGVDFTDCTAATMTNNYNSTSNASDNYPPGITTILWTATDTQGNIATCIQTVTITGSGTPTLTCPDDMTVSTNDNNCEAQVFWQSPSENNNCGLSITGTAEPGDVFPLGMTSVTYTATDSIGNITMCSFNITVQDNTAPVAICPPDITLDSEAGICGATLDQIVVPFYGDNCGIATVQGTSHTTSDVLPIGTTAVSYVLADPSGNTRLCNYNVTVNDNENPVIINCPMDVSITAPAGECEGLLTVPVPMFGTDYTDCQEGTMMTNDYNGTSNASDIYPVGTTTVVWTATDPSGNTATCQQTITVAEQNLTTDQTLVTDKDVFVGANFDNADFHQSDSILINDPGIPDNAMVNSVILDFFFSPEGNSCERDVEIEVTDPSGNVFPVFVSPTNTCNGTDAIFQFFLPIASVPTESSGGGAWKLRFRDVEDHNPIAAGPPAYQVPPGTEYSVRFGRITYNITIDPDCDPMLVSEENDSQVIDSEVFNLNEIKETPDLKLFPVPTTNELNIEYFSTENENIYIEIMNANGQIIFSEIKNTLEGKNILQMELGDLSGGLYYIKVMNDKGRIQAKPFTKM